MSELFYPTIDLFIYDLRSPLNSDSEEIDNNLRSFRARLPRNIQLKDESESEIEYLELVTPPQPKLIPINLNLEGYYYPVRLNDIYGLQIDCSVNNLTDPQSINAFSSIRAEIEQNFHPNLTIGQTWLISGWLAEQDRDTESLAKDCYKILFTQNQWSQDFQGKGTFLHGDFFELWQSRSDPNDHVMILLFPDRSMAEKAANFYTDWIGLFSYRHKITWAYHQSRLIKEALVNHYKRVDDNVRIIKDSQGFTIDLTRLQKLFNNIQDILNKYTLDLLNLSFQKQIIEINLINYRTRLEKIKQKAGEESDLTFLDRLGDLAQKKYLPQIAKDNENMQLGLQLLQTNINALRSQIELEKSERDRSFQNLVTVVGTGTAIATLFDFEGKKCKAIFNVTKEQAPSHFCNNFLVSGILTPLLLLVLLGLIALGLKKVVKIFFD
jgi:hypothetical protein